MPYVYIGMYSGAIPCPKAPTDLLPSYRPLYAPLLPLYNRYNTTPILYLHESLIF